MSSETGMDQVIDAVTEAICQLVLFSVEAEENNTMLVDIGTNARGVQGAVGILIDIAEDLGRSHADEPKLSKKMLDRVVELREASSNIVSCADSLSKDNFDQEAKKGILAAAKDLLQGVVQELHWDDKYKVMKIVKAAEPCTKEVQRGAYVSSADEIMDVARKLSAGIVALMNLVVEREKVLVDPEMKRRMADARETLKAGATSFVKAMGEVLTSGGDASAKAEEQRVSKSLLGAIDEIVQVAIESCKTMFDSLDMDFGLEPPRKPTIADLRRCHEEICREVDNLSSAVTRKQVDIAKNALHMITNAVRREVEIATIISEDCEDYNQKQDILEACDEVETMPAEITTATRAVWKSGSTPSERSALAREEEETKARSAAVLAAAARGAGATAAFLELENAVLTDLSDLRSAIDGGQRHKAAKAAKKLARDAGDAVAVARAIADACDDPYKAGLINAECDYLENKALPALLAATTNLLKNPDDPDARAAYERAVADVEASMNRLHDATTMSPEELLAQQARLLEDELRMLVEAVNSGDVDEAARRLKAARDGIQKQIDYAKQLLEDCDDPLRRKKLQDAIADLEQMQMDLVPLTKAALAGDEEAKNKLNKLYGDLAELMKQINEASHPTDEERIRKLIRQIDEDLDELQDALDRGDTDTAKKIGKRIHNELEDEMDVIRQLEEKGDNHADVLKECRKKLEALLPLFDNAKNDCVADPYARGYRDRLDDVSDDIKRTNRQLEGAFPSTEDKVALLSSKIDKDLRALEDAARRGDKASMAENIKKVVVDVGDESTLGLILADQADDNLKEKHIREDVRELKNSAPALVAAVKAVLANPSDKRSLDGLHDACGDTRRAAHDLSLTVGTSPEQAIIQRSAEINANLSSLPNDAKEGNLAGVKDTNVHLKKAVPKHLERVKRFVQDQGDNPLVLKRISEDGAELERMLPAIDGASDAAAANPSDAGKQKTLHDLVIRAKGLNDNITAAALSPDDQIDASTLALDQALREMKDALDRKDWDSAVAQAEGLKASLDQQIALLKKLADAETDPERKKLLLGAIDKLQRLRDEIDPLIDRIRAGDLSAVARLKELIDEAKGANDLVAELTVRPTKDQLIENAVVVHAALKDLDEALAKGDKSSAERNLARAQKRIMRQKDLAREQAGKEADPALKAKLNDAARDLDSVFEKLPGAVGARLANPRDAAAQKRCSDLMGLGHDATDRTVEAVRPSLLDQLVEAFGRADRAAAANDRAGARAAAKAQKDVALRLAASPDEAPKDSGKLRSAADAALGAAERFDSAAAVRSASAKTVEAGVSGSLEDEALGNADALDRALDRAAAAVRRGNRQDTADAVRDAQQALRKQADLARALAALCESKDPERAARLRKAAEQLESELATLQRDANRCLANPDDRAAKQKLAETIERCKNSSAAVVCDAFPNGDAEVARRAKDINADMKDLLSLIRAGDKEGALRKLAELEDKMRKQAALCRSLGIHERDPKKKKGFFDAAMALNNALNSLLGPLGDMIRSGGMEAAAEMLEKLLDESNKRWDPFYEEPKPVVVKAAPADPVENAAWQIERVVDTMADGEEFDLTTPQGRLYHAAREIARQMVVLSRAGQAGNKKDAILSAKKIADLSVTVFKNAKDVADVCKDPRLAEQVMSVAHAIRNTTTQLKIITAVRAASTGDDSSTVRAQLIRCAKNLSSNVINVCNGVEIACIRVE